MIQNILRFLPIGLRGKIEHRHGLLHILDNIAWLFFDKSLRIGVGLIVGVWIARYLGPEQFGIMSYALAFVGLFTYIATLGFNSGIVVRDLVQEPATAETTMGTAFVLQALGGICAFAMAVLTISCIRPNDYLVKNAVAVLAMLMVLKATDIVKYWFESLVQSKFVVWTENGVILISSAVKIGLILADAPLMAFIWILFFEGLLTAACLLGVYAWRGGHIIKWRIRFNRAILLLKDSWPLILSGFAITIYMRIDQIMLGHMIGDRSVGIYNAAVKISEVWYFIPMAIVPSVFPAIIEAKKKNEATYYHRLQKLYDTMVLLALSAAIPMTFLSDWLVNLLFGTAYLQAGPLLTVHVWAGIFVFLGVASGRWYLIEGLQRFSFYRALFGAVVNVGLNMIMIPKFGMLGAAWATVVSQASATMFFNLFSDKTRPLFFMQCKSFVIIKGSSKRT